jgi:Uma2 family endonuclease
MATVTKLDREADVEGDQKVVLANIGWKGYSMLLRLKGDRRYPKVIYLDGSVTLVSPSYLHDHVARLLGLFVTLAADELDLPHIGARSTTFRRRPKRGGVEADESFYFKNLERIRGKKKLSLRTDPPPDLAIEVVVSLEPDDSIEVYRRFGVPEVWICDPRQLTILRLGSNGHYAESERSSIFQTLTASEIHAWVTRDEHANDLAWGRALRRWVADVLVPRQRELMTKPPAPLDDEDKRES